MLSLFALLLQAAPAAPSPEPATPRLRVAVPAAGDPQPPTMHRQPELVELLSKDPTIEIIETRLPAGSKLREPIAWMPSDDDLYLLYQDYADSDLALYDPSGVRLWSYESLGAEPSAVAWEVARVLEHERWHRALLGFSDLHGESTVRGRFGFASGDELELAQGRSPLELLELDWGSLPEDVTSYRTFVGVHALAARDHHFPTIVTLVVTNPGEEPLYLTVLSVGEDRHHALLHLPSGAEPEMGLIEPQAVLRIPVRLGSNLPWDQFRPMRNRFFLIASRTAEGVPRFLSDPLKAVSSLDRWVREQATPSGRRVAAPEGVGVEVIDLHVY